MQRWSEIKRRLDIGAKSRDPLFIIPRPYSRDGATKDDAASVDLRLGTWFLVSRQTKVSLLEIPELSATQIRLDQFAEKRAIDTHIYKKLKTQLCPQARENQLAKLSYVRFGRDFILHPRSFALAVTLEWLRIPRDLGGYVTSRSSWGRRGLIIATAVGIHPGFTGCLTLELGNVGDVPIAIRPGMSICQLFLHKVDGVKGGAQLKASSFAGKRRPALGEPKADAIALELGRGEL